MLMQLSRFGSRDLSSVVQAHATMDPLRPFST